MDAPKKSYSEIQPVDEEELDKDLRFLFHNRSDTVDQFVEEAIPVFKYHLNKIMDEYQDGLLDDLTENLRGEIVNVMIRTRRGRVIHPGATIGRDDGEVKQENKPTGGNESEHTKGW